MSFHCADEMPLRVAMKELSMNDVNVFACVKNHKLLESHFERSHAKFHVFLN
jgi:hypothetical protein